MEDVPRAPREDGAPRAPKSVSIYSPNKSKAKKTSSKEPAKLDNDGELERLHKELHSTRAQLTDLEERSLEYRKQAGLLRERMRGSDDKEKSLQTQLDRLLRDSDTMSRKLSDATKLGEEMTADRDKVVQERDTILERSRVATVEAGLERERLQSMQRDALASLEKLGNQLLLLEKEKAEVVSKLDASRRECEGLRARVVDTATLTELQQDKGASMGLKLAKSELERSKELSRKLESKMDEHRRKTDEVESLLRLEKAARSDESRLAREKNSTTERAIARLEEALKSQSDRSEQLTKQVGEMRAAERATTDEKVRLQARVRALEASTKQMEASAARQLSGATSAGEGSSVELIRVDLTHAQRRAEDAERHEKRATEEAQEERRMREQAEQSHAESLRHLRLTNESSQSNVSDLERRLAAAERRAAEMEQQARGWEEKLAREREAQSAGKREETRAERREARMSVPAGDEVLRQSLEMAEDRAVHAEKKAVEAERRVEKAQQELEKERKLREKRESELQAQLSQQAGRVRSGTANSNEEQQHQREVTLLNEQLNAALREAAAAKLALRVRADSSPARLTPRESFALASPTSREGLDSPKKEALLSPKKLLSPHELEGSERRQYKRMVRAGKEARDADNLAEAVKQFRAAAKLASDDKLNKTIEKLEKQMLNS